MPSDIDEKKTIVRAAWQGDRTLWAILIVAALLGLIYNFVILPGFGPDEGYHVAYIKLLLDEHRLPLLLAPGRYYADAHPYHPPLYYVLEIPFFALGRLFSSQVQIHLMRLLSTALCLSALPLTYQIALAASDDDRNAARLATAMMAFLPIFGMFCGIVNNDSATLLAITVFLWLLAVKYPNDTSLKSAVVLGVAFGLGALCKGSVLLCDGTALLAYFWTQAGRRAPLTLQVWKRLGIVLLLVGLIAGWWYWRNHLLYGQWQPVPIMTNPALPSRSQGILVMMMHDNFPPLLGLALWGIFYSLWSQKDWIPEMIRTPIYLALALFCLMAAIGAWRGARSSKTRNAVPETSHSVAASASARQETRGKVARRVGLAAFVLTWLSCLMIALFVHWGLAEGGRYLAPGFAGFAVFLALGWRGLVGSRGLKNLLIAWTAAFLALNAVCIYWLLAYLNPTFGPKGCEYSQDVKMPGGETRGASWRGAGYTQVQPIHRRGDGIVPRSVDDVKRGNRGEADGADVSLSTVKTR